MEIRVKNKVSYLALNKFSLKQMQHKQWWIYSGGIEACPFSQKNKSVLAIGQRKYAPFYEIL